jgi:hypothetical protein
MIMIDFIYIDDVIFASPNWPEDILPVDVRRKPVGVACRNNFRLLEQFLLKSSSVGSKVCGMQQVDNI